MVIRIFKILGDTAAEQALNVVSFPTYLVFPMASSVMNLKDASAQLKL